jgi:hypothetical protein
MTDTTITIKPKVTSTFGEVLAPVEPEMVRTMITAKLDEALGLINSNNALVARIQESKNTDPENTEYQDATWRRVAAEETDAEIVAAEAEYQALVAQAEELLKVLRAKSREHMQPAMSEEDIVKARKQVNEGKAAIDAAVISATTMAEMADQMLTLAGAPIEGGVMTLMPNADSLLNTRGRKSKGGGSKDPAGYAARIGSAAIDGVNVEQNGKVSWNILAQNLSDRFNAKRFAGNAVTGIELEEAFYKAIGAEWRDKSNIPDAKEFEFEKNVEVQNTNDDGTTTIPQKVVISFTKWMPAEKVEETPANDTTNDAPVNEDDANDAPAENANEGETEKPSRRRK